MRSYSSKEPLQPVLNVYRTGSTATVREILVSIARNHLVVVVSRRAGEVSCLVFPVCVLLGCKQTQGSSGTVRVIYMEYNSRP
jgi:hypothetical protein